MQQTQQRQPGGPQSGPQCDQSMAQLNLTGVWQEAFWQAYRELQVERLKEHLSQRWGRNFDQAAQAMVRAMERDWDELCKSGRSRDPETVQRELLVQLLKIFEAAKGPAPKRK